MVCGCRSIVLAGTIFLALMARPSAHDIPADVTVRAFLKPEGQRLHLLVRAPMAAMRDVQFPTRGVGNLDLAKADSSLRQAAMLWIADNVAVYEDGVRLGTPSLVAARVSLPADRSFESYESALANVTRARLPDDTELFWNQGMLDALFEYPIRSDRSEFSIHPGLARLGIRVTTGLRFLPRGGAIRAFEFSGDPGVVRLDPRWHQSALRFIQLGFTHILDGIDHLLFLFCLVIPLRRVGALVAIVTSFTVAHSITLIGSAFGLAPNALWFPPLVESLIALSIVYMAFENIVGARLERRWLIAFGFGLVHGFGFSFALRESMQFAGTHLLTSLLAFNVGVELGQLVVLALLVPALAWLFRFVVAERIGTILLSALVAHTGWHWMLERGATLRQYEFQWPALDVLFLAAAMRWIMLALVVAGVVWLLSALVRRLTAAGATPGVRS
jgi:hypothetical protein